MYAKFETKVEDEDDDDEEASPETTANATADAKTDEEMTKPPVAEKPMGPLKIPYDPRTPVGDVVKFRGTEEFDPSKGLTMSTYFDLNKGQDDLIKYEHPSHMMDP